MEAGKNLNDYLLNFQRQLIKNYELYRRPQVAPGVFSGYTPFTRFRFIFPAAGVYPGISWCTDLLCNDAKVDVQDGVCKEVEAGIVRDPLNDDLVFCYPGSHLDDH